MPANQLRIRGSKNGIIIQFEEGDIAQAVPLLEDKLKANPEFFLGTEAILVFPLEFDLDEDVLLRVVRILSLGKVKLREIRRQSSPDLLKTATVKETADVSNERRLFWVERRLRSGDKISVDGDLVLIGDVNPGAEISAKGNILVWGSLLGVAHAGREGDDKSRIMALRLKATQLRIAGHISRAPDESLEPQGPEVARVGMDGIVIETWEKVAKEDPQPFWRRLIHGREV